MTHYNARTNEGRKGATYKTSTKLNEERFLQLQREGCSAAVIADRLGVTPRTVQRHRVRLGVAQTTTYKGPVTEEWKAKAKAMVDDGCSISEVARTLGSTHDTVKRHFPHAGWDASKVGEYARMMRTLKKALRQQGQTPLKPLRKAN